MFTNHTYNFAKVVDPRFGGDVVEDGQVIRDFPTISCWNEITGTDKSEKNLKTL